MDTIIGFFRDTLDGPVYIAWIVGCIILIFACIEEIEEKGIKNKKEKEKYANVNDTNNDASVATSISEETNSVSNEVGKEVQESVVTTPVSDTPSEEVKPVSTTPVETTSVTSSSGGEDKQVTSNSSQDISSQPSEVVSSASENNVVVQPVVEPVGTTVVNEPVVENVATTSVNAAEPVSNTPVGDNVSIPQITPNGDNASMPSEVVIPTINQDSK